MVASWSSLTAGNRGLSTMVVGLGRMFEARFIVLWFFSHQLCSLRAPPIFRRNFSLTIQRYLSLQRRHRKHYLLMHACWSKNVSLRGTKAGNLRWRYFLVLQPDTVEVTSREISKRHGECCQVLQMAEWLAVLSKIYYLFPRSNLILRYSYGGHNKERKSTLNFFNTTYCST